MKKNTEIIVLIDKSGSMNSIQQSTIDGFNSFILEQKEVNPEAKISLIQFDDEYEVNYESLNIKHVKKLDKSTYVPRGLTALRDAMGRTIVYFKEKQSKEQSKVIFAIITDGYENASKEFSHKTITELVDEVKNKFDWEVVYLGANQDAIKVAENMGIAKSHSMTFSASDEGMTRAFYSLSKATSHCMSEGANFLFEDDDRKMQDELMK